MSYTDQQREKAVKFLFSKGWKKHPISNKLVVDPKSNLSYYWQRALEIQKGKDEGGELVVD